ncbi:hypothetical protein HRI_004828400 [Hibiscus trionum]|uniref:25S rRNA (uridine-N(3))-methyltransferase BMT5-like domain-containing protein n=1 Tax=Hibiscus trionum TaxID=183268 RepID=A0A9W7MSV8_HIBTR|nr:hypothetical protein HRI_004828400 [Hibiscus trionum]
MGRIISFIQKLLSFFPFFNPIKTCSSPQSEKDSSFRFHQNVDTTCIDILEETMQNPAAWVLNMENLEERQLARAPERWIRHYCSSHRMLLVGEGDFSFSASLARAFGSATNMVATSLNTTEFLFSNYKKAMENMNELKTRGSVVLHGIDATEMANHCYLGAIKFDRIIYNFPHAGFRSDEPVKSHKRRNRSLILLFFKNAKEMVKDNGEIHVTHKSNRFFLDWNLQGLAAAVGLRLIQELPFKLSDFPGYRTKYGFGGDKNFNCHPSKTYKFGLF